MESLSRSIETIEDEVNSEKIQKDFKELPSSEVVLLANHLMRPDGFIKALVTGKILTSEALKTEVGPEFVKTHRGHYMSVPPSNYTGHNDYISFNVGRPQLIYAAQSSSKDENAIQGLGFTFPVGQIYDLPNVAPSWGNFHIEDCLEVVAGASLDEPQFDKYKKPTSNAEREAYEYVTPKEDFLPLVHLARKAGNLDGKDRAEINMHSQDGMLPEVSLNDVIILIPQSKKAALERLFKMKNQDLVAYKNELKALSEVDVENASLEDIESKYGKRIYWYPQQNVDLAVQYLTTHPNKVGEMIGR